MSVVRKPPLTLEQRHRKKLNDWKLRRALRLVQTRSQANQNADCMRISFWREAYAVAGELDDIAAEEERIEEELSAKREASARLKKLQERELAVQAYQQEETLKAERRRTAEFYAQRAKERFNTALQEEHLHRTQDASRTRDLGEQRKVHRRMEDQIATVRREHFRQKYQPVEVREVDVVRRDSMVPRGDIPHPTQWTPLRSREVSEISSLSTPERVHGILTSPVGKKEVRGDSEEPPGCGGLPDREEEELSSGNLDMEASVASIISLDKENMVPVSFADDELQADIFVRMESVGTSARSSSSTASRDSIHSLDSITIRRAVTIRAVQLSPPKQPHRHPFHDLTRPRISPLNKQPGSPRQKHLVSPRKALPRNSMRRNVLRSLNNVDLPERPDTPGTRQGATVRGADGISRDLHDLMNTLKLLDDLRPGLAADSFDMSASSGPLSSADFRNIMSDESWISHQSLSQNTSFLNSSLSAETGTLFTSFSTILSQHSLPGWDEPEQRESSVRDE